MKVSLVVDGRSYAPTSRVSRRDRTVEFAVGCRCAPLAPVRVEGKGIERRDHDSYYARAVCVTCGATVGQLRVQVDTLFGIEEDERVLAGPWRVY